MADKKISALTGATTPLAGTEVLPIVQSGATVKVSVDNLTTGKTVYAKNVDLTAGRLFLDQDYQITWRNGATNRGRIYIDSGNTIGFESGAGNTTRMVIDNSGNITASTGNFVQGTAAKGINFTANTPAAGMTSQLLNWYEEGTFSPTVVGSTSAGTATYQYGTTARYTRIGRVVYVEIWISWVSGTGTGNLNIGGLPFSQSGGVPNPGISIGYLNNFTNGWTAGATPCGLVNGSQIELKQMPSGGGGVTGIPYSAAGDLFISAFYSI